MTASCEYDVLGEGYKFVGEDAHGVVSLNDAPDTDILLVGMVYDLFGNFARGWEESASLSD